MTCSHVEGRRGKKNIDLHILERREVGDASLKFETFRRAKAIPDGLCLN